MNENQKKKITTTKNDVKKKMKQITNVLMEKKQKKNINIIITMFRIYQCNIYF